MIFAIFVFFIKTNYFWKMVVSNGVFHFFCYINPKKIIFTVSSKSQPRMDYANVMRSAVELGPEWIRHRGYFWKQLVNLNMFIAQLG